MKIDNTPMELLDYIARNETLDINLREAAARVSLYCTNPEQYAMVLEEESSEANTYQGDSNGK